MPSLRPARTALRHVVTRTLRVQRTVTEWQVAAAGMSERQVHAWFELHRTALQAALRYSEAAAGALGDEPRA